MPDPTEHPPDGATEAMLVEGRELATTMYGPRPGGPPTESAVKLRVAWDGRAYALAAGMAHAAELIAKDLHAYYIAAQGGHFEVSIERVKDGEWLK